MQRTPVYEVRQKVYGLLNGTFHAGVIVEVGVDAATGSFVYYVRFIEQDSRLDRWLEAHELKERHQGRLATQSAAAAAASASLLLLPPHAQQQQQQQHEYASSPTSALSPTTLTGGGVTTRRQSMAAAAAAAAAASTGASSNSSSITSAVGGGGGSNNNVAKGSSGSQHNVKVSTQRARKDSAFFSRTRNIRTICMGMYEVEAWYFSPYHLARPVVRQQLAAAVVASSPSARNDDDNNNSSNNNSNNNAAAADRWPVVCKDVTLHICPYCVRPMYDDDAVITHVRHECLRHPPGDEVYRDPVRGLLVLEVDGKVQPVFCEHLALLSKLFLEHKALDHDMTPFLFYVLCAVTSHGLEVLGYFSKEKHSPEQYNLSCILVLPQFQSRGIGRFLIELSYELSWREGKLGTPEKPLSDLGEKLYLGYWSDTILTTLAHAAEEGHRVSIDYLVQATALMQADVVRTLQHLRLLTGNQLYISEESLQRCEAKRLRRESADVQRSYVFYRHLLNWAPGMYAEWRVDPPSLTRRYVLWHDANDERCQQQHDDNKRSSHHHDVDVDTTARSRAA